MSGNWPPPRLADFATALPFEHLLRKRAPGEAMARWAVEAQALRLAPSPQRVAMLLSACGEPEEALQTLACWSLQTWPHVAWVLVGDAREPWRERRNARALPPPVAAVPEADAATLAGLGIDWVVPAAPGDLLHPSLAGIVGLQAARGAQGVAWDWLVASRDAATVRVVARRRGPFRDDVADLAEDCRGRAFAVPVRAWRGEPRRDAWRVRMALGGAEDWQVHPEPLGIYPVADRIEPARPEVAGRIWGVAFEAGDPGRLQPAEPAAVVSVVILYRDRVELTLNAIRSVLAQRLPGPLELVLVDNQSSDATRALIAQQLRELPDGVRATTVAYAQPFNHSRQCNLGAQAASGDVLVFLNNDAQLLDADGLDRMARWARVPGVASVGARIVDAEGRTAGGGFRARRLPGAEYNSPVEEAGAGVGDRSRTTVGNTFACAAVSAAVFREMGGLDEVRFPVGYNDVDYCLRSAQRGWRHVNLADVRVSHAVGASRARTDEIAQKLALRVAHPWLAARALQEFDEERVSVPPVTLPGLPDASAAATDGAYS